MKDKIYEDINNILNESFKMADSRIDKNTLLLNGGLNLNSLQLIELTVAIENYYNKEFDTDTLTEENFSSVEALADLIQSSFM
ncbi:phosphopantetheine-binding protein [Anaerocolumna sp. AGMB13025]|uniref:phosphopantetheine-binding protein n=1 Tax=Anaerocolumna sp. AGMB13025 TaxID=3039116 RepID=UPI00241EF903|nr:phosphopantetheine-binding protein [Anaerocolumna sp. AGMB13025]WFR56969.1 phosphopantetheine-binding protein [Anaerocolumna sp. AGMB13025]